MKLEFFERCVQWLVGASMAAFAASVLATLWRQRHREIGRTVGALPSVLHSFWFYVPASGVALGLLAWLWRPLPLQLSPSARVAALAAGTAMCFPGLALMLWGRRALGAMYDVSSSLGARLYAGHQLVTSGPFALVRHPMYLGVQLAEVGALLLFRNWATLLFVTNALTLFMRARREEEALAAEFGEEWQAYRRRVPFWLPRLRGDSRSNASPDPG